MKIKNLTKYYYKGVKRGQQNKITNLIYLAKFFHRNDIIFVIAHILFDVIKSINIDLIVYCKPTKSKINLPQKIASLLSIKKNITFLSINNINSHLIKNKNILIFDDVITTGATMQNAIDKIKILNPKIIYTLAIAKSPNFIQFNF